MANELQYYKTLRISSYELWDKSTKFPVVKIYVASDLLLSRLWIISKENCQKTKKGSRQICQNICQENKKNEKHSAKIWFYYSQHDAHLNLILLSWKSDMFIPCFLIFLIFILKSISFLMMTSFLFYFLNQTRSFLSHKTDFYLFLKFFSEAEYQIEF